MWFRLLLLSLLLSISFTHHAQAVSFVEIECDYSIAQRVTMDCGQLEVLLDYAKPDGDTIILSVVILRQPDGNPEPDPIIYLEGGPGGSILKRLDSAYRSRFLPLFSANRDIIIFDQRGVGLSEPALDCPAYNTILNDTYDHNINGVAISNEQSDTLILNALKACGERLSDEYDLSLFNSANSARDIDTIREALGYEQINLWGISYGTRLALTAMRDNPDAIRSVVLDSVYPPNSNLFMEVPTTRQRALDELFAACLDNTACNTTYPSLEAVFYATVQLLNEFPLEMTIINTITGNIYSDAVIDGDDFLMMTLTLMYQSNVIPILPQLIYQMHTRDYGLFAIFAGGIYAQQETLSIGKYYAVQCHEEVSFIERNILEQSYLGLPELERLGSTGYGVGAMHDVCESFEAGKADALEDLAVISDIPTLVLSGEFDPITPPSWAQRALETLSNGVYIEFPYQGHGVTASNDCARDLMNAFIQASETDLDTRCIQNIQLNFRGTTMPDNQSDTAPML